MPGAAIQPRHPDATRSRGPAVSAFLLTAGLLTVVQLVVENPLLLAERFVTGGGWLEVVGLATYAAWLAARMQQPGQWRRIPPGSGSCSRWCSSDS